MDGFGDPASWWSAALFLICLCCCSFSWAVDPLRWLYFLLVFIPLTLVSLLCSPIVLGSRHLRLYFYMCVALLGVYVGLKISLVSGARNTGACIYASMHVCMYACVFGNLCCSHGRLNHHNLNAANIHTFHFRKAFQPRQPCDVGVTSPFGLKCFGNVLASWLNIVFIHCLLPSLSPYKYHGIITVLCVPYCLESTHWFPTRHVTNRSRSHVALCSISEPRLVLYRIEDFCPLSHGRF